MAIAVLFEATGSWQQYLESIDKLDKAGWGSPKKRLYHVAGPTDEGFRVLDVWDSPEALEEFGAVLIPIIQQVGFTPPELQVWPAERIIEQSV